MDVEVKYLAGAYLLWIDKDTRVVVQVEDTTLILWHLTGPMPSRSQWEQIKADHFPTATRIQYERDTESGRRYVTINLRNVHG